jgi:hypothetical protein
MTSSHKLGKIILLVEDNPPYGRCETGADVRGYPHPNAICIKRGRALKRLVSIAAMVTVVLVGAAPALAQGLPVAMVDCVIGGICIGTSGHDTITGSYQYDEIYGLEGDDIIDPGSDLEQDYISCGPGFDTVNQESILGAAPDVVESDCEVVPL